MSRTHTRRQSPHEVPPMTETVYAVRAHMVDGSALDLLLFAIRDNATDYAHSLSTSLPLGFDRFEVVERTILGTIATADERAPRATAPRS